MNPKDRADCLLERLMEELPEYRNTGSFYGNHISNREEVKRAIRSLMNLRMPGTTSQELFRIQDQYLQNELQKRGVVSLQEIPTIWKQYGSHNAFADKIALWQGDITRLGVGAIVNAANSQMLGCFVPCHRCIDNAIHSAAGMQLRDECDRIMRQRRIRYGPQYEEPVGMATLTKGYNLPCEFVIHTVGPVVSGRLTDALCRDLRNCYESVLQCCVENRISSVAFCCISTGEFHFPKEKAAQIAVDTVMSFLERNQKHGFERILFNVFQDSDREIYEAIFREK